MALLVPDCKGVVGWYWWYCNCLLEAGERLAEREKEDALGRLGVGTLITDVKLV